MKLFKINGEEVYSAIDVRLEFGISMYVMRTRVKERKIDYVRAKDGSLYIPKNVIDGWYTEKEVLKDFKTYICEILEKYNLKGDITRLSKYFNVYLKGYDYFGMRIVQEVIYMPKQTNNFFFYKTEEYLLDENIKDKIIFRTGTNQQCIDYMLNDTRLSSKPISKRNIKEYLGNVLQREESSCAEMINYLRNTLKKELCDYKNEEISEYIRNAEQELTKKARYNLIKFYTYMQENEQCLSDLIFTYDKTDVNSKRDVKAYELETYMQLAFMIFNEKYAEEHGLLEKAVENILFARTWLYHAMHFVCAWRSGDIQEKLPRIKLCDEYEVVLERIKNKQYSEVDYKRVTKQLMTNIRYKIENPNKTERYETAPPLRLHIPESLSTVIGMLVMLCEAHNQKVNCKESLINNLPSLDNCIKFFGKEYENVLKGTVLCNRKANKAYLSTITENGEMETDGYLIAAYARSHTQGINNISDVTSCYLEAKMNGYSKDDISKTLFERGICSFVPYMLCEIIDNEQFLKLSIQEQTEEIKSLSCSPGQIEQILDSNDKIRILAKQKVQEIMKYANEENLEEYIKEVLETIATGKCTGKTEGVYCLLRACKQECVQKKRETCIGCSYEIYATSILDELSNEIFLQQQKFDEAKTDAEKIKRHAILNERLYPAAFEVVYIMKNVYKQDITEYKRLFVSDDG